MDAKLELELASESYELAIKSTYTFYLLLAIITYLFWGKLSTTVLLSWVGINYFTATLFLLTARWFKRHGTEENAAQWLRIYTILVVIHDTPWGFLGPISNLINDIEYVLLSMFYLVFMASAGFIARAPIFRNYVISLLCVMLPTTILLVYQDTALTYIMSVMLMVFMLFMFWAAQGYSQTIKRKTQLWLDNEKLIKELREYHAEVDEANRGLTLEIDHRKLVENKLLKANNAKSQFLATVSHELRTPLNGIIGFTELLQSEVQEVKHKHYLDQISKAGKTLLNIINDILDINAIEAGKIRLYEESFSIRSELNDLVIMLQPMVSKKGLYLELQIDEEVKDDLCGDIKRLRQIVANILSNALKYTNVGGVVFHVSCVDNSGSKIKLHFDIEDTGIGISVDKLETIFNNFTRVEGFETRRTEGTGLGLAIVKNLVHMLDGSLDVKSEPGQGSCFSFELAFEPGKVVEAELELQAKPGLTAEQWVNLKALIVDDNGINRMLLSAFLAKLGIQFVEAANGQEALEYMRADHFDVVLLDIQMPDFSGFEVADQALKELKSPPILIAVTAHAFPEQRKAILDAGFTDFLIKPISFNVLTTMLAQVYRALNCEEKRVIN
ncbi:MAG: ATP-binding protein [Candidatus Thiodiazotropha sp. 6PLUC4]